MNNSVFGKTMENLCKRVDVRLVTNEKKLDKLTSKPTYVSSKIFNENLMAVHKVKETLTLNRPAYVGMCIPEFGGLKSKMYSYVKDNEKGGRTAKGIKKNIIKNNTKHEDYKNTLINNEQMHHKMKTIRSQRHQLGSYEISKVSLSCFDDKRYIHDMEQAVMPMDTTK